MVVAKVAKC